MPDGLAPVVIAAAGPLVLETFLKHYLGPKKAREDKDGQDTARVDLVYDEAFAICKEFMSIATHHTVASLQKFGSTRTPAPPWVAVKRINIPHQVSMEAASFLITALGGEENTYKIAGGTKWWQVRAGPGVEAEWISMKRDYRHYVHETKAHTRPMVDEETEYSPEMDKMRCMLYIHGGARYYWGSINTHRYIIWRLARKMRGRCFAVNYRKAPQYPFPCAIQDCIAAWLYLVKPPPGAAHKPVDPKNIIIAGDSAGGGLVWSLLQILRDTPGLDLPAGAVLISPWSDLTHSFPSILQNTETDIVPPYSFIHKPSSLWPPPPPELTQDVQTRIANKAKLAIEKMKAHVVHGNESEQQPTSAAGIETSDPPLLWKTRSSESIHTSDPEAAGKLEKLLKRKKEHGEQPEDPSIVNPNCYARLSDGGISASRAGPTLAQSPDVLRLPAYGERIAIDTQIQLYATNAQLCHPFVSPVLGYLGGLPPIYVLAGDSEVLRDEIIYAAHKAAHPEQHPLRDDVKQMMSSMDGIEQKYGPTNVHLQVYDGVGHDLPLFSMTRPARGAFRAIASFCRYVTPSQGTTAEQGYDAPTSAIGTPQVTSEFAATPSIATPPVSLPATPPVSLPATTAQPPGISTPPLDTDLVDERLRKLRLGDRQESSASSNTSTPPRPKRQSTTGSISSFFKRAPKAPETATLPPPPGKHREVTGDEAGPRFVADDGAHNKATPGTAGYMGIYSGPQPFKDHMIRERVNFDGVCRPLEPESQLGAMTMPADQIGMIKEGPAMRYVEGQAEWDAKFKRTRRKIARHRAKNLGKSRDKDAAVVIKRWQAAAGASKAERERRGSASSTPATSTPATSGSDSDSSHVDTPEPRDVDGTWAWQWALNDEAPPPSAIVSRRDLPEGRRLALLADRTDTSRGEVHALSLWVLLANFFSSSHERRRTRDAVKEAKEIDDEKKRQRKAAKADTDDKGKSHKHRFSLLHGKDSQ